MAKTLNLTQSLSASLKAEFLRYRPTASPEILRTHVAVEVLRFFLGTEWVNPNVFSALHSGHEDRYFRVESAVRSGRPFFQSKVEVLAEMLLNLQFVDGFEARLSDIQAGSDLESAIGELEGAKLLKRRKVDFQFVIPTGTKGQDYDVEINLSHSIVPCEMKTKLEATAFSKSTLENTLEQARKQLPPTSESCVFVRFPGKWRNDPEVVQTVQHAIDALMRRSSRIGIVCFHWEEWHRSAHGPFTRFTRLKPYIRSEPVSSATTSLWKVLLSAPTDGEWPFTLGYS